MFERETRREKILEARNKELRLKEKTKGILGLGGGLMGGGGGGGGDSLLKVSKQAQANKDTVKDAEDDKGGPQDDEFEDPIVKAEREFFQIIKQEQDARLEQRKQKQGADEQEEK